MEIACLTIDCPNTVAIASFWNDRLHRQTRSAAVMTSTRYGPSCAKAAANASSSWEASVTRMPCAPHTRAYSEKLGLCNDVCHTSHSAERCSLEILPSCALFNRTCVIGMSYFTA